MLFYSSGTHFNTLTINDDDSLTSTQVFSYENYFDSTVKAFIGDVNDEIFYFVTENGIFRINSANGDCQLLLSQPNKELEVFICFGLTDDVLIISENKYIHKFSVSERKILATYTNDDVV